ncbi:MAG: outer membrane protein assembly factor BamB, partial [Candidatus Latescibacterota bacterium]
MNFIRFWMFFLALSLGPFSLLRAQQASNDWASWGGPTGDFTVRDAGVIQADLDYALKVVWKKKIGTGYSAVSVRGTLAVTMFSDDTFDYVIALDAEEGSERWRHKIGPAYLGHYGSQSGPLSTMVLTDSLVIGLSAQGRLFALDIETGVRRWGVDLVADYQAIAPFWGFTSSPRLHDNLLFVQLGGTQENAIAAFNPISGDRVWSAYSDSVSYQSPGLFKIGNQNQVVFHGNRSLAGLNPQTGAVLWQFDHGGQSSASATSGHPVEIGEGRYFVKHRGNGGVLVQVHHTDGVYSVEEVWQSRHIRGTYIYAVYHKGYLFGNNGRILTCIDAATGDRVWRSREPGDGLPIVVDDHLVMITKEGKLAIAKASGDGYDERARLDLFDDIVWSPPSFANGKIYTRSMSEIACVEIVPKTEGVDSGVPVAGVVPDSRFAQFVKHVTENENKKVLIDQFMAKQKTFPIIEGDRLVHFVYRGEANEVGLTGDLIGRRFDQAMHRIDGTDFFYYSAYLEPDARSTYQYIVNLQTSVFDSLNDRNTRTLFFGQASWFAMPQWKAPAHLTVRQDGIVGRIDTVYFESDSIEGSRRFEVYLPAGYDQNKDRYPVTYVHASRRPFSQGLVNVSLDNLIGKSVRPMIVVVVPSFVKGGYAEYMGDGRAVYAQTFANEVVPFIDRTYRTLASRTGRANMGHIYGGFMAFYATFKYPNLFGKLAIQTMAWDQVSQAEDAALLV